MDNLLD